MVVGESVYLGSKSLDKVYLGEDLIYQGTKYLLSGQWTEDSSPEDWWWSYGRSSSDKINLSEYTDPETKEFYYYSPVTWTSGIHSFSPSIKHIYHIPDISNLTSMNSMFENCNFLESVNLSNISIIPYAAKVLTSMFNGCYNLKNVNLSGVKSSYYLTGMSSMFCDCRSLEELDLSSLDTSSVTTMNNVFYGCRSLKTLNLSGFNFSSATKASGGAIYRFFKDCTSLTTILGPVKNIKSSSKYSLDVSQSPLTNASAMVLINGLIQNGTSTCDIIFSQDTYDSLTPEQISIATSKGWNVVRS